MKLGPDENGNYHVGDMILSAKQHEEYINGPRNFNGIPNTDQWINRRWKNGGKLHSIGYGVDLLNEIAIKGSHYFTEIPFKVSDEIRMNGDKFLAITETTQRFNEDLSGCLKIR